MSKEVINNISNIQTKIKNILEYDEGDINTTLEKVKNLVDLTGYDIKPKKLLEHDSDFDVTISSGLDFSFCDYINRIDKFINEIVKINSEPIGENDDDERVVEPPITLTGNGDDKPQTDGNDPLIDSDNLSEEPLGDIIGDEINNGELGGTDGLEIPTLNNDGIDNGLNDTSEVETEKVNIKHPTDGIFKVENPNGFITDSDGNIIGSVEKKEYKVYEFKYDSDGNLVAVRISPDGEEERWILLEQNGLSIGQIVFEGQAGVYQLHDGQLNVYDVDGKPIGIIDAGEYIVYEIKYDNSGNPIMIRISPNGEEEQWLLIDDIGILDGLFIGNGINGMYMFDAGEYQIFDGNGNIIGMLNGGKYTVYEILYGKTGNPLMIRISPDGMEEKWINISGENNFISKYIYENQFNIPSDYINNNDVKIDIFSNKKMLIAGILGLLSIAVGAKIYARRKKDDKEENIELEAGDYTIYAIDKDEEGNVTDICVNDDFDDKYWVHL